MPKKMENNVFFRRDAKNLDVVFSGKILEFAAIDFIEKAVSELENGVDVLRFKADNLQQWDSSLLLVILNLAVRQNKGKSPTI